MPSSTSSSERRWGWIWLAALLLTAGVILTADRYWRGRGFEGRLLDNAALWSIQRDRVYGTDPLPLVFLGASRTQYGFDMKRLRELAPGYKPLMLAVNGLYPMAVLRDLAEDESFRGVVICDVELFAFWPEFRDVQQDYVDYYHRQWTPSWRIHRHVLNYWQEATVLGDPRFSWLSALRYATGKDEPFRDYALLHRNRSGDIDYQRIDTEASKRHFAETAEGNLARMPYHNPEQWLASLDVVFDWVARIEARGGKVIFYRSPVSGLQESITDTRFPPGQYWSRFLSINPVPILDANAVPALDRFELPDDSHLDFRDKAKYTETWLQVMQQRGLLPTR
ncbi:MAG: hypothetical protein R3F22_00255 [Lysobacteraceae bacterium]